MDVFQKKLLLNKTKFLYYNNYKVFSCFSTSKNRFQIVIYK